MLRSGRPRRRGSSEDRSDGEPEQAEGPRTRFGTDPPRREPGGGPPEQRGCPGRPVPVPRSVGGTRPGRVGGDRRRRNVTTGAPAITRSPPAHQRRDGRCTGGGRDPAPEGVRGGARTAPARILLSRGPDEARRADRYSTASGCDKRVRRP